MKDWVILWEDWGLGAPMKVCCNNGRRKEETVIDHLNLSNAISEGALKGSFTMKYLTKLIL